MSDRDGFAGILSLTAFIAALASLGIAGYLTYESAEARAALERIETRQQAIAAAQERLDRYMAEQVSAIHQSMVSEVAARSALGAETAREIDRLRETVRAMTAALPTRVENTTTTPDPYAHIPKHDEPEWFLELRSIRDADVSALRMEAEQLQNAAEEHLRRAEEARDRGERFETQRLERLGFDTRREARRLESRIENPDLVLEGVDSLGRSVIVHLDRRWRGRVLSKTPGEIVGFRGRPAVNSGDRLELVDASLLRNVGSND
jgi:hypothetical protein